MREWSKPAGTLLLGFGIWLFCIWLYLTKLPISYTYDGMVFASRVESAATPLYKLFHPHHLLYTFLGRLFYLWGGAHGALWDGMVALQFFDILIGSLGILIAFHLLVRVTQDRLISALGALGLCFTFSYWYFSTSPGVRIFAAVTPLLAWYSLTYLRRLPPIFGLVVGSAHALAVLGHQTNLLLLPAFIGGILLIREKSWGERLRSCLYYLGSLSFWVLAVYGFVGRFIYIHKTYESWIYWVFAYFHVPQWGGYAPTAGLEQGKLAMVKAFLAKTRPQQTLMEPFTFDLFRTFFSSSLWVLFGYFVLRLKPLWISYRQTLWVGILWIAGFVPFFLWWEPWNIEFWVSSTIPCWILISVVFSDLASRWKNPVLHFANRAAFALLGAVLVGSLFSYNFHDSIRKTASAKGPHLLLEALDWKVRKSDLLVLTGINTVPFYLDRYQKRDYLSLHAFLKRYKLMEKEEKERLEKERKMGKKPQTPKASPTPPPDPWKDAADVFQSTWKKKRKVWVLKEVVDEKDSWHGKLENLMKLPKGKMPAFFAQYELKPVEYQGKVHYYEILRPAPTATPIPAEVRLTPAPLDLSIPAAKGKKK